MPVFADRALAERIELCLAEELRRFTECAAAVFAELRPCWLPVAGGVASFAGPGSPVNQAGGVGFDGPVMPEQVDMIERFFRERETVPAVNACPLADDSLVTLLAARGWRVAEFENVLVRPLHDTDDIPAPDAPVEIRLAETRAERALWADIVAEAFAAPDPPTDAEQRLGEVAVARRDGHLLLAYVDGCPAGTGELHLDGGIGWLSADATLPRFRRRGVQRSLQRERLRISRDAGCDLAVTESVPGSASQRNMERLGFTVAYTRAHLVLLRA